MHPVDYGLLHAENLSVWDKMEEKQLLGATARRCFQYFSFASAGFLWALSTLCICVYGAVCPNVGLVDVYGGKATRMVALMVGLASMCSMSATKAAKNLLESREFGQLLTHYETQRAESAISQRDVHDYGFECPGQSVLLWLKDAMLYGLVFGISLRPTFASDKSYFIGCLMLVGWMAVYSPGYKHVFRQVKKLSKCLVQELIDDIHDGPENWNGSGKFWQDMTKKHHRMDLKIESAWMLATWVVVPDVAHLVLSVMIALVACLSAAVHSTSVVMALASLLGMGFEVHGFARRLQEMASITRMCMSAAATSKSIMSLAIAQSGPSPYSPDVIKKAGYDDVGDERTDHALFLAYLKANQCGVEIFGVLIDSELILRVLAHVATAFLALLSYLLATLDIHEEDVMLALQHLTSVIPFKFS